MRRLNGFRTRCVPLALLCIAVSTPLATAQITGGGGSWVVTNTNGTSNGLPSGGSANSSGGFGIQEATFTGTGQSDAFDNGLILWVNNTILSAPGFTTTATSADSGLISLAGLNVRTRYQTMSASPTLRTYITFTNPSGTTANVTATLATNVGSDAGTQIIASSSGDLTFTTADRWLITDDASTTTGDPANTHIIYGPGSPLVLPASVSQTVFSNAGTEGVLSNFNLSIPAGGTLSLLLFNQVNGTAANAQAGASLFDTNPILGSDLLQGLTQSDLDSIVNWQLGAAVPEPSTCLLCGTGAVGLTWSLRRHNLRRKKRRVVRSK